jgi:hypothetical protein
MVRHWARAFINGMMLAPELPWQLMPVQQPLMVFEQRCCFHRGAILLTQRGPGKNVVLTERVGLTEVNGSGE